MSDYFKSELSENRHSTEAAVNNAEVPKINGHIHSPYSFSAFSSIEQPFEMARAEGISVLGINDFYTTDGYDEFAALAVKWKVFPLFNIEFMALHKSSQAAGTRINDPQNPGRTYLSGKGLRYPVSMRSESLRKLQNLQEESNLQTYQMVEKLNRFLLTTSTGLQFSAAGMQKKLARNLLRERHIATAIRLAVFEKYVSEESVVSAFTEIFSGKAPKSPLSQVAALENEIRNNLLKAGGPAFVEENEKAFLSLPEVIEIIQDAGGIPCYPVLLDDARGNFTDFEGNYQAMADILRSWGIYMIELIPGRNDFSVLKDFVHYMDQQGFCITFGSEHNTPQLDPLAITCRGGVPLGRELTEINYKGSAIIAAHQYLVAQGKTGFPSGMQPSPEELAGMEALGKTVIANFIQ